MSTFGMRGADLRSFMQVARQYQVILLVRHSNEDSLQYIGRPGFYPKPIVIKAKTADLSPPATILLAQGVRRRRQYDVAGLVVHPGFHPAAYHANKLAKARVCWEQTMAVLSPTMCNTPVRPDALAQWGVERRGVKAPRWSWRIDVDPNSATFGCIQLKSARMAWSCIHGDYDLKDVIVLGQETDNRSAVRKIDGVKNCVPLLEGMEFKTLRDALNRAIGAEMVQHGAEAQFAWHGDEGITVVYPNWEYKVLADAVTVQGWYRDLGRKLLAKTGKDYLSDRTRMFHAGANGLYAPGQLPPGMKLSDLP